MKSLHDFFRSFFSNNGHHVLISFFIAKICGFAGSLLIIRLLPESEFGVLSIVLSVFSVFLPFTGFGSGQSLIRFGSLSSDENEKHRISSYFFFKGMLFEVILMFGFLAASLFFFNKYENTLLIFIICMIRLGGFYFVNHIQAFYRISTKNKTFATINNVINVGGLFLMIILTFFFKFYGYLFAIAITPFFSLFWIRKEIYAHREYSPKNYKEMWRYGVFTAVTSLISETLFSLDIILLGFLMNENAVANYRVAILIPSNITFLAVSFLQSDFPLLSKNYQNKNFLRSYVINFHKIFLPICAVIFVVFIFFNRYIIQLFFGDKYINNSDLLIILLIGFNIGMLTRNLYGNLLPAVGKIEINTWVSLSSLMVLVIAAYFLIPIYGVVGMGIAMTSTLLLSGFFYLVFFFLYLRKLS
ncbi:oligosaccharide flippase family protein [Chryseobacterium sp. Hurlbut01]|uniref:oligosaccharide flippase family protein n=1 Tax=Chryseobacterium sp. Hurlbut01 TaxID=1681828 RepID=UPI00067DF5F1|nr:oligosaccharide flippase family protein [Chryseobacterium sp. Hurlbut01]KNB61995.1 hypothetical protein AC804_03615 [Chryseobacterium sp. Hurlbut01]